MNNSDMPAMPVFDPQAPAADFEWVTGLTKLEIVAALFTASLLTATTEEGEWSGINAEASKQGISEAKDFFKALEQEQ